MDCNSEISLPKLLICLVKDEQEQIGIYLIIIIMLCLKLQIHLYTDAHTRFKTRLDQWCR
jgi:hypothetical protein